MSRYLDALGPALRLLRSRRHLKQTEVADRSGLTKAMLSSYETGKSTPSLASLDAILEALETDFSEFQTALRAVSGVISETTPFARPDTHRDAAWSELREVLRELLIPLERVAVAIERLSGSEAGDEGAITSTGHH